MLKVHIRQNMNTINVYSLKSYLLSLFKT